MTRQASCNRARRSPCSPGAASVLATLEARRARVFRQVSYARAHCKPTRPTAPGRRAFQWRAGSRRRSKQPRAVRAIAGDQADAPARREIQWRAGTAAARAAAGGAGDQPTGPTQPPAGRFSGELEAVRSERPRAVRATAADQADGPARRALQRGELEPGDGASARLQTSANELQTRGHPRDRSAVLTVKLAQHFRCFNTAPQSVAAERMTICSSSVVGLNATARPM